MKITMKTIADKLGISINTVSQALRGKPGVSAHTRELVRNTAAELGYSLKSTIEQRNICLVSTEVRLHDSYFYMNFLQCILTQAQKSHFNVLVYNSTICDAPPGQLRQRMREASVSAVILLGDLETEAVEKLAACGLPVIALGARYFGLDIPVLIEDNLLGAHQAVEHFYNCGFRTIGFVGRPANSTGFAERYAGYQCAMEQFGLQAGPCITDIPAEVEYDFRAVAAHLQRYPVPQAFLCANDNIGMVVTNALHHLGYEVPKDISIIGFDNSSVGKMIFPSLFSVDVQCTDQAALCFRLLVDWLDHGVCPAPRTLTNTRLISGDSAVNIP